MSAHEQKVPEERRQNRLWLLLLLFLLILVVAVLLFYRFRPTPPEGSFGTESAIEEMTGEKFSFSDFYQATEGTWIIRDEEMRVQTEQKFMSPSEFDRYTVHVITPQDRVTIVESQNRWKKVEIFRDGAKLAEGWLDANFTKDVESVEAETESE